MPNAYITEYTDLPPQERRQLTYKRRYKADVPAWDDSMVLLTRLVGRRIGATGPSVLDLGCGHGNFVLDELREVFGERIGYDVDAAAVTGNVSCARVVLGNPDAPLPFADGSFGVVVSLWAMEHIEHPAAIFNEVARVLSPGGIFAFVTPNRRALIVRLRALLSDGLAARLVERFYGRREEDAFPVRYRANDLAAIRHAAESAGLVIDVLRENADPTYTAFGPCTYALSRMWSALPWSLSRPHIVAVLRKGPAALTRAA
jgi:SAM-dependent methyltransferase